MEIPEGSLQFNVTFEGKPRPPELFAVFPHLKRPIEQPPALIAPRELDFRLVRCPAGKDLPPPLPNTITEA